MEKEGINYDVEGNIILLDEGKIICFSKLNKDDIATIFINDLGPNLNINDVFILWDGNISIEDVKIFIKGLLSSGIVKLDSSLLEDLTFLDNAVILPARKTTNENNELILEIL